MCICKCVRELGVVCSRVGSSVAHTWLFFFQTGLNGSGGSSVAGRLEGGEVCSRLVGDMRLCGWVSGRKGGDRVLVLVLSPIVLGLGGCVCVCV